MEPFESAAGRLGGVIFTLFAIQTWDPMRPLWRLWNYPSWAVSTEIAFYFIFPFVMPPILYVTKTGRLAALYSQPPPRNITLQPPKPSTPPSHFNPPLLTTIVAPHLPSPPRSPCSRTLLCGFLVFLFCVLELLIWKGYQDELEFFGGTSKARWGPNIHGPHTKLPTDAMSQSSPPYHKAHLTTLPHRPTAPPPH